MPCWRASGAASSRARARSGSSIAAPARSWPAPPSPSRRAEAGQRVRLVPAETHFEYRHSLVLEHRPARQVAASQTFVEDLPAQVFYERPNRERQHLVDGQETGGHRHETTAEALALG